MNTQDDDARPSFRDRIYDQYDSLTTGYQRLANFLLEHTFDAAFLNASELARRADVDPATVVRFAQVLGYPGYRELSEEVQVHVRAQVELPAQRVRSAGNPLEQLKLLTDYAVEAVQRVIAADGPVLLEMVGLIRGASCLWISGEGVSLGLAQHFAALTELAGVPTRVVYPGMVDAGRGLAGMVPGDVLLAVAFSNPSVDSSYLLRLARQKGVKTLCLSGSETGPATHAAELRVVVPTRGALGLLSFGPAGMLLNLMWEALIAKDPEAMLGRFVEVQNHMMAIVNLRAQAVEIESASPQTYFGDIVNDPETGM